MYTYNGLKKVECTLESNKIVIDGVGYEICSIKETASNKSKVFWVLAMLSVVAVISGGEGAREFFNGDKGFIFLIVPFILLIPVLLYLTYNAILIRRTRSLWTINIYHTLYIENDDNLAIENALKTLSVPDKTTLAKQVNPFLSKNDMVVLIVLFIVLLMSFSDKVPNWTAMLFPCYAVWVRIKDIIWDYKKLRWNNQQSVK
jgi:hypothetical protein